MLNFRRFSTLWDYALLATHRERAIGESVGFAPIRGMARSATLLGSLGDQVSVLRFRVRVDVDRS